MKNRIAVVIGATGGIGRAIALRLLGRDTTVYGVGRRHNFPAGIIPYHADLTKLDTLEPLYGELSKEGRLDMLVHAAGVCYFHNQFDLQYAINTRAPYYITRRLLPLLVAAKGQVIFLNSLAGLHVRRPEITQYAATKHALRAVADGFRAEVNPKGVRITSIYLGQVATPMQEAAYREAKKEYQPESLLQPEEVARTVLNIVNLPESAEITDLTLRSTAVPA